MCIRAGGREEHHLLVEQGAPHPLLGLADCITGSEREREREEEREREGRKERERRREGER